MKMQTQPSPPNLAKKLLLSFLRHDLVEEVQGDLEEKFYKTAKEETLFGAKLNYWYQVFHYVRPFAIRKSSSYINHFDMLQNYFKIGWRNMSKQKMYSLIKVGGFALGIAACLLITLFIRNELSYDRHYPKGEKIFRIVQEFDNQGTLEKGVHLPAPFGPALLEDYPEIEQVARINPVQLFGAGGNNIRRDGQEENTFEEGFVWADPELMQMLDVAFIHGDAVHALSEPNSLVITKSKADKYFPDEDPLGKIMIIGNNEEQPYKIGGVIADPPATTHLRYDFYMTLSGREFGQGEQTNWLQQNYPTYVLVKEGTDPESLAAKLQSINTKYYLPRLLEFGYPNAKELIEGGKVRYKLQPIDDIYLNTMGADDGLNHGDIRFTWLSGAVAAFILIIACINFVNLSTAKSANRAKEVGLRKVVGSFRSNLVNQFLTESLLYSVFSFLLGLILAWLLIPYFNTLVGKDLVFPWREWWLFPGLAAGVLIVGILAGLYPSFYLSSFKPIEVMKGNIARGSRSGRIRSVLVVFQFTTSIILIIGTLVIYRQLQYILNVKIGFDKSQVMLIQGTDILGEQIGAFKNELLRVHNVSAATVSDYLPIRGTKRNGNTFDNAETEEREAEGGQYWLVDEDYLKTMGMRLLAGRDFSDSMATDADAIIINEAMAKALGYEDPIGKKIRNFKEWTIIGVVQDFNFESLRVNVEPLCLALGNSPAITSVKINTSDVTAVIESVAGVWKRFAPQQPIRYTFLDQSYARMYEDVERMGRIFTSFALLAIIVACLGLLGLSSFMVEQRSKEISIRLVLGASVNNIFRLLTQNFVKLVLLSFTIAVPVAWYLMHKWLEDYVHKTEITPDVFAVAGLTAVVIALATVSYQAIRAAFANPAERLRAD